MTSSALQHVLVTGATGFIGGRLVRKLIEDGKRVSCLVRSTARGDRLAAAGAELTMGDVTDQASVARALERSGAEIVFHLAGVIRALPRSEFMRVNQTGTDAVAAACAAREVAPVLVIVSSLAAAGPCPFNQRRTEGDMPVPVSMYGRSKLAGEMAAAKYAHALPITIVRPPVVFGPGDRAVLELFRPIARWNLHVIPGWRDRRMAVVHVDDLVEGLLRAAANGERLAADAPIGRGIYFMADREAPTYAQLGLDIAEAMEQKRPRVIRVPGPLLTLCGLCGDILAQLRRQTTWVSSEKVAEALATSWNCTSEKAQRQLGWMPAATLAQRLRETAQWYRQANWL